MKPAIKKAYNVSVLHGKSYRIMNAMISEILLPYNISLPEWKLLGQLVENGNMKLAKLAELLGVEAPLVTSLVDRLEQKGLVIRTSDLQDKRAKVLEGTPKAAKMLNTIEPKVQSQMQLLVRDVTDEELSTYCKVLEAIVKNA